MWISHIVDSKRRTAYISLRADTLSGLHKYQFPCIILDNNTQLAAVAKIFETRWFQQENGFLDNGIEILKLISLYVHINYPQHRFVKGVRESDVLELAWRRSPKDNAGGS